MSFIKLADDFFDEQNLSLGIAKQKNGEHVESRVLDQQREPRDVLRRVDDISLSGHRGDRLEQSSVVPVEALDLVVVLDVQLADGSAGGGLGVGADPGPELTGQEAFGAAGAVELPVGLLKARKAAELLQLADRRHVW